MIEAPEAQSLHVSFDTRGAWRVHWQVLAQYSAFLSKFELAQVSIPMAVFV